MTERIKRLRTQLKLPFPITPRVGDEVVWYVNNQRAKGRYLGHGLNSEPIVLNSFGSQLRLPSFDCLRLSSADRRVGPNWEALPEACLMEPFAHERARFLEVLKQRIPPGPTYLELIEEIWQRGYEVYVVGGSVRDVISGEKSNDVDIVTAMPIMKFEPLLKSMFHQKISVSARNGYARLGGIGKSGDPFIDLKLFCHCGTGSQDVLFGSDFALDIGMRDFACNAIYYDPINEVLVDPSGRGLVDAAAKILSLVCDSEARSPQARGQIAIRYFKFLMRGYSGDKVSDRRMIDDFIPCLSAMANADRLAYVKRQILAKIPSSEHIIAVEQLENVMRAENCEHVWVELFAPLFFENGIASGGKNA